MVLDLITIYEDQHLLALSKPACIHSVSNTNSKNRSLADLLVKQYPALSKISKNWGDGGLVHRLDFETSGVLIAAKNKRAWELFYTQMTTGEVQKKYLTLVEGRLTKRVTSSVFIGSPYRRSKKVRVLKNKKPRFLEAHSTFTPVRYFKDDDCSLVEAQITAGRRHQIRAHLAFLGFPIMGDTLYESRHKLARLTGHSDTAPPFFLHAQSIKCVHPVTGKPLQISAPIPSYMDLK